MLRLHYAKHIYHVFNLNLLLLFYLLCHKVFCDVLKPVEVVATEDITDFPSHDWNEISLTSFRAVFKYQCLVQDNHDSILIVHGARSWEFPPQDVNLTLSYPTDLVRKEPFNDYIISGFKVYMFVDSDSCRGNLNAGGIGEVTISMSFMFTNITKLAYHLWIYGIPKQKVSVSEYLHTVFDNTTMC